MTVFARDLIDATAAHPVRPAMITGLVDAIAATADALHRETMRAATADLHRQLAELTGPAAIMRAITPTTTDAFRLTRSGAE